MPKPRGDRPQGSRVSLAPLTPDRAMRALLKVDPKDVAKLEARERRKKAAGKKKWG